MKIIKLTSCETSIKANILKSKLESEGISCFLTNQNISDILPYKHGLSGSGVQIMINEEDYSKAADILNLKDKSHLICPSCGSSNVKAGFAGGGLKNIFKVILSLLGILPSEKIDTKFICRQCDNEFVV